MAFLKPEYTREAFHVGENRFGERIAIPAFVWGTLEKFVEECGIHARDGVHSDAEIVEKKWWVRLSASGYMDCTEWDGPYDTEIEARKAIVETYECDPDTGDDTDEST